MPKPKDARAAFDAGYCSGKHCRDLVGSGEGIQDYTDPEKPKRFCWRCYQKLEAVKDKESKPAPDMEPEPAPVRRRVVVVRRNT